MNPDKKQTARHLYAQTDLSKTQIANMLGLHRVTISNWVRDEDWDRLKRAGMHLPSILAENCYHIIGHLTEYYLSEHRAAHPITHKEADTLYKLSCTISKLRARSVLNETMEMLGHFLENVRLHDAALATSLAPHIEQYLASRAHIYTHHLMPAHFTGVGGRIPNPTDEEKAEYRNERNLDKQEEYFADPEVIEMYRACNIPLPAEFAAPPNAQP